MPAPSPITKPSRSASNGREARFGSSLRVERARIEANPATDIGVIARAPEIYPWLVETLSAARVKEYFAGICLGEVERHEVPNLAELNFLLGESLGGGGTVSLRLDAQGKTLSHALLAMRVSAPRVLLECARRGDNEHRKLLGLKPLPARRKRSARKPAALPGA